MAHVLTTDAVPPRQLVAYWQEMVCQTFVQAHCESRIGESFRGRLTTEVFDGTEISRIEAGPQRIQRRPVDIARACKPRYYLCYHAAGRASYRDRHSETVLGPGDMILLDNSEPYAADYHEPVTSIVLHVPHALAHERLHRPQHRLARLLGQRLDGTRGLTRVAGDFLQSCLAQAEALSETQRPLLAHTALDLFAAVLADAADDVAEAGTPRALLLARTKWHIDAQLADPGLNPEKVAAAMGVSVRHLARLFELEGLSFGRYLLQQRIERCRRALADPRLSTRRVGRIAFDHGFNNLAHFSRVFREATGCSPSDYRDRAASLR